MQNVITPLLSMAFFVLKVKELTRREEAAERLAAEYEKKLLLLQQKESLELVKVSITSRRRVIG